MQINRDRRFDMLIEEAILNVKHRVIGVQDVKLFMGHLVYCAANNTNPVGFAEFLYNLEELSKESEDVDTEGMAAGSGDTSS